MADQEPQLLDLIFRWSNDVYHVSILENAQILDLKKSIATLTNVSPASQTLVGLVSPVNNESIISSHNLQPGHKFVVLGKASHMPKLTDRDRLAHEKITSIRTDFIKIQGTSLFQLQSQVEAAKEKGENAELRKKAHLLCATEAEKLTQWLTQLDSLPVTSLPLRSQRKALVREVLALSERFDELASSVRV
eukprot:TRINITY_DN18918_c0_g1_i1.p1 TRINITY_DN18918_c0_g1~~TRINITY_DN18918_c0_g1_i1.p1  ORF type:complete len:207 (-),score=25.29 TRINITY_DN18918_c0_g1_i1:95-667(-)